MAGIFIFGGVGYFIQLRYFDDDGYGSGPMDENMAFDDKRAM